MRVASTERLRKVRACTGRGSVLWPSTHHISRLAHTSPSTSRRKTQLPMPLQIIGAGFGRNGTLSLKTALEELGYKPCYHMVETFTHPEHAPIWTGLHNGTIDLDTFDWEILFGEYSAAVDWPPCTHWESQMKFYPDAKVILSVRDPEAWYKSMCQTIIKLFPINCPWYDNLAAKMPPFRKMTKMTDSIFRNCFDSRGEIGNKKDKEHIISCYNKHNELVKATVPKDRLLVFRVTEGWGPLCKFLGVPVPNKPFPNVNDTNEFQKHVSKSRFALRTTFLALSTAIGVGLYGTFSIFPGLKRGFHKGIGSLLNLLGMSSASHLLTY